MGHRFFLMSAILAAVNCLAQAQIASFQAPASGLLYDAPSRSLRPLVGFPGSTYLGKPALEGLEEASIAPDGRSAVVFEDGRATLLRGLGETVLSRSPLDELAGPISLVAWASNSASLVAYSSARRSLLRFDLGSSGPLQAVITDLSYLEGVVTGVLTNHDASETVVSLRHPEKGGLYGVKAGAGPVRLSASQEPLPAFFSPSGNVLYAIDGGTHRIIRFPEGIHGASEPLSFSGDSNTVRDPVGLALSLDGQRLFLAGGSDRMIREYDLQSRTLLREIQLDFVPQRLSPVPQMASVFVLASRESRQQPVWLLDTRFGRSISFTPASE